MRGYLGGSPYEEHGTFEEDSPRPLVQITEFSGGGGLWGSEENRSRIIGSTALECWRLASLDLVLATVSTIRPLILRTFCGIEYRFPRAELVPRKTTPCLCGRLGCFLIAINGEPEEPPA